MMWRDRKDEIILALNDPDKGLYNLHPRCGLERVVRRRLISDDKVEDEIFNKRATRLHLTSIFAELGVFDVVYLNDLSDDEFYYLCVGLDKAL
jgi:hypothetical protein